MNGENQQKFLFFRILSGKNFGISVPETKSELPLGAKSSCLTAVCSFSSSFFFDTATDLVKNIIASHEHIKDLQYQGSNH